MILPQCRNLIGQSAVVDKSTDDATGVKVLRSAPEMLKAILWQKTNRQRFIAVCTPINKDIRRHSAQYLSRTHSTTCHA